MTKVNVLHIKYVTRVDKIGKADSSHAEPKGLYGSRAGFCLPKGLYEVRDDTDATTFVFLNEVYVRFDSVDGGPFNVYPYTPYDNDLALHDVTSLTLHPDKRFERVIDNLFRRECIDDNIIHEYVFRIFRRPTYGRTDIPAYWDIGIHKHDVDLPRYAHSPAPTEMLDGEFKRTWTDEQRDVVREFRAYSVSFPRTLTEEQFIEFYMQRIKDSPSRADARRIWKHRTEMGLN